MGRRRVDDCHRQPEGWHHRAKAPWRFEAGTPNTGGIIGLGAALDYVSEIGLEQIGEYEQTLMRYALEELKKVPDLTLYGPQHRLGVIAFNLGKTSCLRCRQFSR